MAKQPTQSLYELLANRTAHLPRETVSVVLEFEKEDGSVEYVPADFELQAWTSRERDEFEADSLKRAQAKSGNGAGRRIQEADLRNFRARLVSRTVVEGSQHSFANPKGEELLGNQPASILDRLFTAAQKLHGMSNEDVENLVGNAPSASEETTADDSSSSSLAH